MGTLSNAIPCQPSEVGASAGFTLPEMLVSASIGSVVLAAAMSLSVFGARSFASMSNYVDLDSKSRNTLDYLSRSLRQSTSLVSCQTNSGVVTTIFTNTLATNGVTLTFSPSTGNLVYLATGGTAKTLLSQCTSFSISFYSRAPVFSTTNITFYPATNGSGQLDPTLVKLVNLSWKASRALSGSASNTENLAMAQIVLRNKM